MGVGFYIKKLKGADWSKFIETSKRISKINKKPWRLVFMDIMYCGYKYGSGHVDYESFEMYNMTKKERENVLTIRKNNELVRALNDQSYAHFFEDKADFNERFKDYLKRDWLYLNGNNKADFAKFLEDKEEFYAKPLGLCCGKGIEKIKVENKDNEAVDKLYDELMKKQCYLVEEEVFQNEAMNKLSPAAVNTVRVITIVNNNKVNIVAVCVRISRKGMIVDNFNAGGLCGIADVNTGVMITDGFDKVRNIYIETPDTHVKVKGYQIPNWEEIQELINKAALEIPQIRYVGWDVCVSEKYGPLLIEGNSYPGQDVTQFPKINYGTYSVMKEAIK